MVHEGFPHVLRVLKIELGPFRVCPDGRGLNPRDQTGNRQRQGNEQA